MNKVILIGRLTKDPELRFAAGTGTGISRFTVAINRRRKEDGADFINCVAFGKTAETISQYFTKGRQIGLIGHMQTGSFLTQDGTKRYTTDVVVETFDFLSNGQANQNTNNDVFGTGNFDDITPVDDDDRPF